MSEKLFTFLVAVFSRLYLIISIVIVCFFRQYTLPSDCYLNIHGFMAFHRPIWPIVQSVFLVFSHTQTVQNFIVSFVQHFIHIARLFSHSSVDTNVAMVWDFLGHPSSPDGFWWDGFSAHNRFRYFISIWCCHPLVVFRQSTVFVRCVYHCHN